MHQVHASPAPTRLIPRLTLPGRLPKALQPQTTGDWVKDRLVQQAYSRLNHRLCRAARQGESDIQAIADYRRVVASILGA